MKILLIGSGKGSWAVRGHQLGGALGARVRSKPKESDLIWADLIVLIKRVDPSLADRAHALGKPIVWDALDFWLQPDQNSLSEGEARTLLAEQIAIYQPDLVIGATQAMASAAKGICLPHHSRPGLIPTDARPEITTVAYEGTPKFLGRWNGLIQTACHARGWTFLINPPDLGVADLLVACRSGIWEGWMCHEWKSGVKIVNAVAAGRPIVLQGSAAERESPLGSRCSVIETAQELETAFSLWSNSPDARIEAVRSARQEAPRFALSTIADRYRAMLEQVLKGRRVAA